MSARHVVRGLVGVLLCAGAIVLATLEIYHLVRTGTCASGGPYVSARPCPPGTGGQILLLVGSIFVLAPLGVGLHATRRSPSGGAAGSTGALTTLLWCCVWVAMGSAAFLAGHGPAAPDGAAGAATSVAITFWGIGGVSIAFVVWTARGASKVDRTLLRRMAEQTTAAPPSPRADVALRLQALDRLRDAGTITAAERDARRAEILREL